MKCLYKYPQRAFPYADLVAENRRRTRADPEYELLDTGIFDDDRYFDVFVEYAKAAPDDILIRISAANRGPEAGAAAPAADAVVQERLVVDCRRAHGRASRSTATDADGARAARRRIASCEPYWLYGEPPDDVLFTENETNAERLFGAPNASPYVKDAFHEFVVDGRRGRRESRAHAAPKAAPHYVRTVGAGRDGGDPAAPRQRAAISREPFGAGVRRDVRRARAGGRRVLPARHAVRAARRHAQRPAAGVRRHAVEQAVLPLSW